MDFSQKEMAAIQGVTVKTIQAWQREKDFPVIQTPSGPRYDGAACTQWRIALETGGNYQAERTRLTKEQADQKALENARAVGELIPATEVRGSWTKIASTIKQRFMGLPRKVAPHCVGKALPEIEAELNDEIKSVLRELAGSDTGDFIGADAAPGPDGQ